jgi:hypothetical protein
MSMICTGLSKSTCVTKGAPVVRERPQGSSGGQRNAQDGVNICVFAKEDYLQTELFDRRCQVRIRVRNIR